jgi:hypothetical protein
MQGTSDSDESYPRPPEGPRCLSGIGQHEVLDGVTADSGDPRVVR